METIITKINERILKETAKHKLSNGIAKKYKFDYRKDGKLGHPYLHDVKNCPQLA